MQTSQPVVPQLQQQLHQDALRTLEELVGTPFDVWRRGKNGWECLLTNHLSQVPISELSSKIDDSYDAGCPVLRDWDGNSLIVMPIDDLSGDRIAAIGLTGMDPSPDLPRLLQAVFQLLREQTGRSQQESIFEELSRSMDEGRWLRELCGNLELTNLNQSLDVVLSQVLPQLREVIHASSVGFVSADDKTQQHWSGPAPEPGVVDRVVSEHREAADAQPVVINRKTADPFRHAILVPVRSRCTSFGWLLAVDRADFDQATYRQTPSELEFGTVEASLASSAAVMLGTHANNVSLFNAKERLTVGVLEAMSAAVDARDPYTKGHSDRVAQYSRAVAVEMGFDQVECEQIYLTGLLHDVGKIGVPDSILLKDGKLTDDESELIQRHPEIGHRILQELDELSFVLPGVLHHHERIDGQGYPHRLAGDDIPIIARVIAVVDAFDAMTSDRPYSKGMPLAKAESIVLECVDTQFDKQVVEAFIRALPQIQAIASAELGCLIPSTASDRNQTGTGDNAVCDAPVQAWLNSSVTEA